MTDPPTPGPSAVFVLQLTRHQSEMYAAVAAMLGGADGAMDVLQDTNAALLEKAGEYDPARPFLPWAIGFARTQAKAWRKKQSRDRLVLDDDLFEAVAERLAKEPVAADDRLEALDRCLQKLPAASQELIAARYVRGESVQTIAERAGRSVNVVSVSLFRIRQMLLDCVTARLAAEGES